ncbi:response regulator [Bremerella cremea]|uniref:Two-component system response regulator n=1 Tax=Blastopirellula marina TaxID=124 RepID=A0A2S8FI60_9BACT|nr:MULTISPECIES: HD domain-containing phosphohydrolase [Pirellulaceae]PQO31823.1 two-component system response regulator [Blastopirellula marina]RCS44889.1 response regulator [Bremerella cremea]
MDAAETKTSILVVDDDDIALEMIEHYLSQEGFLVHTALDGREALELLETREIHIVITDWEMPVMNGLELCRHIRQRFTEHYIYCILLTSRGRHEEIVEGMASGADDFMVKPFNPPELLARINAGIRLVGLETRDLVIFAMARLAESRDTETGEHLERVRQYSRCLAEAMARMPRFADVIDGEFIRLIYQTSPLHDIGKVGIPDGVLLKPGKLTADEFEVMKRHTLLGADTLDAALKKFPRARFLRMARDIAASHHEKWDGTGYPYGLSGTSIPLAARIVAVADVYDALTTRRIYKEAYSTEYAEKVILESSGQHFDPDVVSAFEACKDEFVQFVHRYADPIEESSGITTGGHST